MILATVPSKPLQGLFVATKTTRSNGFHCYSAGLLLFVTLALIQNGIPLQEVNNQTVRVRCAKMESALAHPRVRPHSLLSFSNGLSASALSETARL